MSRRIDMPDPEVTRGLAELEAALDGEPGADEALALLASDLRADTPRMSAAFAAGLDERVAAGFPRERTDTLLGRARAGWMRPLPLATAAAGLLIGLVAVGLATRDGGGGGGDTVATGPPAAREVDRVAPGAGGAAEPAPAMDDTTAGAEAAPQHQPAPLTAGKPSFGRKVERSAQLTLTTSPGDVQDVADGVVRMTQQVGGIVASSTITTNDGSGSAHFALRVPARRLDDAIRRLSGLAHVGSLSQNADDITAPFVSAAERLSDARAERRALLRALGKATTPSRIASLRARLRANRSEIARHKGELDALRRRANFASVDVAVEGIGEKRGATGGWTPGDALRDAVRVLEVAAGVTLVGLAVLLPLALIGLLGVLSARVTRRRRREQALDSA